MAARNWTPEQRQTQREAIQRWKPWTQSTGPKSLEGKTAASHNAWAGGQLVQLRLIAKELKRALREQRQRLAE